MQAAVLDYRNPRTLIVTAIFVAIVVTVGAVVGLNSGPDSWYTALNKPPFNPPNWVFAPVWFTLYVLIGIAGARVYLRDPSSLAMFVWVAQMVLNWAWSPTWFNLHLIWPAFAIIATIFALICGFIALNWQRDRWAALLFVPYALWVGFASSLNFSIGLLN